MSVFRKLRRGLRVLIRREESDRELSEELDHYLDEMTREHLSRGLSPREARRAARVEFGSVTSAGEQVRSYGWENLIERLSADFRCGARRLRSSPGFTTFTVLTLALGIGATTTIYSVLNPILFEPLPYPQSGRLASIWDTGSDGARLDVTYGTWRELAARSRSFEALALMRNWQPSLTGDGEPERLDGQRVSASYFEVLGVSPVLGPGFRALDDRAGGPNVVILSSALWRRRFGADPAIIGSTLTLDDASWMVAGVMPEGFENAPSPSAEVWTLLQYDMSQDRAWGHHLRMIGRLRSGTDVKAANQELDVIASTPVLEFARPEWASLRGGFIVLALQDEVTRAVRPALLVVFAAVVLVLVMACVNVTSLMLARGMRRHGEFVLRSALGAGRGRLMQQMLIESLLLAALGGVAGLALAGLGVRLLLLLSPPDLPRMGAISLDAGVFAFALAVTTLIGLALGIVPALRAARTNPQSSLHKASRRVAGGNDAVRGTLVIAEISLALILLVCTGLLMRSLARLFAVDAGFGTEHVLTMQVQTSGSRFNSDSTTRRFFSDALEAVSQVPGVSAAALTSQLPLSGDNDLYGVHFDPPLQHDPGEIRGTYRYAVTPGYHELMRIPLRRGRLLDEGNGPNSPRVAVISESMARRRLPGIDPIGRQLRIGDPQGPLYTIAGVVGDVKQLSLALNDADAVYINAAQSHYTDGMMSIVIRTNGNASALAPAVRNAIWSVDRNQPVARVRTLEDLLAATAADRRFTLILIEAFAIVALILAAAGLYGVISGRVVEQWREIGVRSALGATRSGILALILRQGLRFAGVGIVIGIVAAAAATRALNSMLFGVTRTDPATYISVIVLLLVVAVAACATPAWRAACIDPARALRAD